MDNLEGKLILQGFLPNMNAGLDLKEEQTKKLKNKMRANRKFWMMCKRNQYTYKVAQKEKSTEF